MTTVDKTNDRTARFGRKVRSPRKVLGRLGPWQLLRTLGEGATTRVYLARPIGAQEAPAAYAVKSLRREWWNDRSAIEAQRREAWVGQRVNCPNVISVLASGVAAPPHYTVTPYLEGQTSAELLSDGTKPSLSTALWIARQAAQGLDALWNHAGMIHGDVKPANLMVGPDGHTTLLDLGFCQSASEARSWAERPILGTLKYLAPERATSATTVDVRSDLYSLGATLYELIAGHPPHDGDSPAVLLHQHRTERPESLINATPGTPKAVSALVDRLLAKDPLRRPSTPKELVDELAPLEIECLGRV